MSTADGIDTLPRIVRAAQRRGWALVQVSITHRGPGLSGVRYLLSTPAGGGRALTYETDDRGRMFAHATYVAGSDPAVTVHTDDQVLALL